VAPDVKPYTPGGVDEFAGFAYIGEVRGDYVAHEAP